MIERTFAAKVAITRVIDRAPGAIAGNTPSRVVRVTGESLRQDHGCVYILRFLGQRNQELLPTRRKRSLRGTKVDEIAR